MKLFCAFIDYQKAFDTVWRDGLWFKLNNYGIKKDSKFYRIIVNMYKGIKSCVFLNAHKSEFFISLVGVRQGENLSPILFSLFVNDLEDYLTVNNNDYLSFNNDLCNNLLKILVLLYADDTIILANTAQGLQKSLNDLGEYCKKWNLTVNSSKTKITIFGNRKAKSNTYKFLYNNSNLEIVETFRYLGIVFNFNGKFTMCKKSLKAQAMKAMFSLLNKCRRLELPIDMQLELFDKTIVPILLYGCEIWGTDYCQLIESVHLRFCKHILGLKKSTPNCMVYGELGRFPLEIIVKCRMANFWVNIVQGKSSKLSRIMYDTLFEMYTSGQFISKWVSTIHNIFNYNGLGHIWHEKCDGYNKRYIKLTLSNRLKDQYKQDWHSQLTESSKCDTYRQFKTDFTFEKYQINLSTKFRRILAKFRTSNHKLAIESGRYSQIERHRRFCDLCTLDTVGDEYHLVLECTNSEIMKNRKLYIARYYRDNPSMHKFVQLMKTTSDNKQVAIKLAKFLMTSNTV